MKRRVHNDSSCKRRAAPAVRPALGADADVRCIEVARIVPTHHKRLQLKKNALTEGNVTHFLYDAADFVAHMHRWAAGARLAGSSG